MRSLYRDGMVTALVSSVFVLAGCGSGSSPSGSGGTGFSGNTTVALLAASTANDQLSRFNLSISSLSLTNKSGATVNLISSAQSAEFIHLNGTAEPLVTLSVPQGIYTSATAVIGYAQFTCVGLDTTGGLQTSTFAYGATPNSQVTVNLPSPITITGTAMGLSLNLQVSPSATFGSCYSSGISDQYSINPTFNLTPVTIATQPTNSGNGLEAGLEGIIASVDGSGSSLTVTADDGPSWTIASNSSTVYQGISDFSGLTAGMDVDMDAALQADGSLLATRIAVNDTNTANLTVANGPLNFVAASIPVINFFAQETQGYLYVGLLPASLPYNFGSATFQVSEQLDNLETLPFTPSFTAANMVAGQNVSITSHATSTNGGPTYVPAATITLMPQTINGMVSGVSSDGNFTTYTVTLAPYDLMPALAVQPGQTTLLQNPGTVVVYADGNTQVLNGASTEVGQTLRFHGLLFNDNGTLRMDSDWVSTGVTEVSE